MTDANTPAMINLHLGKRLRQRRKILGITQEALGDIVGLTFQQIQKYESAANRMSAAVLWKLAQALEVEVNYFYTGLERTPSISDGLRHTGT